VLIAVSLAGIVLAHPAARFRAFERVPSTSVSATASHFLSGNGSGRWQFWTAAVDEFRSAPLHGTGAGSYGFWWAQHASFTYELRNAHSLYLEVLGELGVIGLLLISGALLGGLAVAARRLRTLQGESRVTLAALTAVLVAFLLGAGIDWIWQLTVVGVVGIAALGLITGPSTLPQKRPLETRTRGPRRPQIAAGIAVLAVAFAIVCAQAIPWLAAGKVSDSQAAVRRGDLTAALGDALGAQGIEPWAGSPYLQTALVAEQQGDLALARKAISSAIRRDSSDWKVWFVASRIQRESGFLREAKRSYETAHSLNPRSPFLTQPSR
jgi:O-antigen ligase